jgi:hypothetical protein
MMNIDLLILIQEQASLPYLLFSLDEYIDEETILVLEDTPPMIPNHIKAYLL